MTLRALLWDVDGTLVDNEPLHLQAFNDAFAAAGVDWRWRAADYRRLLSVAGGRERLDRFIATVDPARRARPGYAAWLSALHAAKQRRYRDALARHGAVARPGVKRLIGEARAAGLPLGIVTAAGGAGVVALLGELFDAATRAAFAVIVSGDRVAEKKPSPAGYRAALAALGVAPGEALAIEDSPNGCQAAVAAGIPTLVTVNDDTRDGTFDGALAVVDGLGEPDAPCRWLAGARHGRDWVDLELLRRWVR